MKNRQINNIGDEDSAIRLTDLFNLEEIQRIQDLFANACGVASIITHPDGTPITRPSNFCHLCSGIIRKTSAGLANCKRSDSIIGRQHPDGPIVQPCLSGGLWDAGTSITVGGRHIANWLIGQVRNDQVNEAAMREYARDIGADEEEFMQAFLEVPVMSENQFRAIAEMLAAFAGEMSDKAYRKYQLEILMSEHRNLDEQRTMLAFALQSITDCVSITDLDDKIIFLNQSFIKTYGYTQEELLGQSISIVRSAGNFPEIIEEVLPKTFQGGWKGELLNRRKDGTEFPIYLSTSMIRDDEGQPIAIIGVAKDITDRKKSERELRDSLTRFQMAHQATFNVLWDWDLVNETIWWNERYNSIFGYKVSEIAPGIESWTDYIHPEDKKRVVDSIYEAIDTGKEYWFEQYRFRKSDGSYATIEDRGFIARDENGKATRMLGAMQDMTEKFEFISQLEKAKAKAEAGDKLKTAFMHNISHEIRTPLNGVLGFSNLITKKNISAEEKEIYYPLIRSSSERLLNTVNNYMDISLIVTGNMEMHLKPLKPANILSELYQKFVDRCEGKRLNLLLSVKDEQRSFTMDSDEEFLRKIFSHLLDNAFKFTMKGEITFGFHVNGNLVRFFISDTGTGIDRDAMERIFDSFGQEEISDARGYEGSGLGLSISSGLVRLLGGELEVKSIKGEGTEFFFTLPNMRGQKNEDEQTGASESSVTGGRRVVLVAEDDETNMLYIHSILRRTNVTILSAMNGREAVACCQEHPEISMVLMDMKMPVMDGLEATRVIKSIRSDVPVIAVTAFAMTGDEKRILEAGCDGYLSKPVHHEVLLNKMKEFGVF